nr:hypothetical protein [Rubrobacter sp.]
TVHRSRRRKAIGAVLACALLGLVLLGASLGLSGGPEKDAPLNRVRDVDRGGLAAPTAGSDAGGGGTGETPPPPPSQPPSTPPAVAPPAVAPPASSPPASVPPDEGPGPSQYAGDG